MENHKANIYTAMLKAQQAFDKVVRSDDAFNYKYAPLDKVIEATRKGLADNGLVIMQFPISIGNAIGVKTIVANDFGATIESEYCTENYKKDPQGIGALITYLRRYAYMAVCGIAPEDDDGASAMPTVTPATKTQNTAPHVQPEASEAGERKHFCEEHNKPFGKMTKGDKSWYSHPIEGGGWCNEKYL